MCAEPKRRACQRTTTKAQSCQASHTLGQAARLPLRTVANCYRHTPVAHLVAVHIEAVGPADVVEDDGLAAHRLERAHRRVHAARQQRHRLFEHLRSRPSCSASGQQQLRLCQGGTPQLRTSSDLVVFSCFFVGAGGADTACARGSCLASLCCTGVRAVAGVPLRHLCAAMSVMQTYLHATELRCQLRNLCYYHTRHMHKPKSACAPQCLKNTSKVCSAARQSLLALFLEISLRLFVPVCPRVPANTLWIPKSPRVSACLLDEIKIG